MPNKTMWPIGLSLSVPALRGHTLRDLKNFQVFFKKKFSHSCLPKKETSTQLGLQVDACGKHYNWREKCRLERLFIVT